MKHFDLEALKAIEDINDEELLKLTGAGSEQALASAGVLCSITGECQYNSFSPSGWATCCR